MKRLIKISNILFIALAITLSACGSGGGSSSSSTTNSTVATPFLASWIDGGNSLNQAAIYTSIGIASTSNIPGSRETAATWVDSDGNFWLYGGLGYNNQDESGTLADLWEYNPTAGTWKFVTGSGNINTNGIYGSLGVASPTNTPGGRYMAVAWADTSGNLWLFGGYGYASSGSVIGNLNDLWKYNISTGNWTWMGGNNAINQNGVYGTLGVEASSNTPGSRRSNSSFGASDTNGNLWLFGGYGYGSSSSVGNLNDLWKYNINTGNWTWMSGSNQINENGTYGTQGLSASTNQPGSRRTPYTVIDRNKGLLWVFGGYGLDENSSYGFLNDLWQYNISTGDWTWAGGSKIVNQTGVYNTMNVEYSSSIPGAGTSNALLVDNDSNLWLFGGSRYDSTGTFGYMNDLWKYDTTTGNWVWVAGSSSANQPANYGVLGEKSPTTIPGGTTDQAIWMDSNNHIWVFGGVGYNYSAPGFLNTLWELIPQ